VTPPDLDDPATREALALGDPWVAGVLATDRGRAAMAAGIAAYAHLARTGHLDRAPGPYGGPAWQAILDAMAHAHARADVDAHLAQEARRRPRPPSPGPEYPPGP